MSPIAPFWIHTAFEVTAYSLGMQVFLRQRRRWSAPALADTEQRIWLIVAAALGAALGSKLAYWLEDPVQAFGHFPDWRRLLEGKSIVGGLLGGLVGVESAKRLLGCQDSTGDAFVLPLA